MKKWEIEVLALMIRLTRSSVMIFNPKRCTGTKYFTVQKKKLSYNKFERCIYKNYQSWISILVFLILFISSEIFNLINTSNFFFIDIYNVWPKQVVFVTIIRSRKIYKVSNPISGVLVNCRTNPVLFCELLVKNI